MDKIDFLEACNNLSTAADELFDLIDTGGTDAVLNDVQGVLKLKAVIDSFNVIRDYYLQRSIQRMMALGISPATLLKTAGE